MIKAGTNSLVYSVKFDVGGHLASTLYPSDLGFNSESGWTIEGDIHEDYYEWVNYFEASHPTYGTLVGDYEDEILAESEEAYLHFHKHHPPSHWDYWDI